jgi:CXXX repeat modification system protein
MPQEVSRKIVGKVTEEEKNRVQILHERKNALVSLLKSTAGHDDRLQALYDRLIADFAKTSADMEKWFKEMCEKYSWESHPRGSWNVNFATCEIELLVEVGE